MEKIRVMVLRNCADPEVTEIGADLASMQELVGGPIQALMIFSDMPEIMLVCNEEGKLWRLKQNRYLRGRDGEIVDMLVGDCFLCSTDEEDFASLTDEQIEKIKADHKVTITSVWMS